MQQPTAAPRDELTAAQVYALIEGDQVEIGCGLELLDVDDVRQLDLSDDLVADGSEVAWQAEGIHRTCRLTMTRDVEWWNARLLPYMTLTAGGVTARFNLGVFLPGAPTRTADESGESVWEVEGWDKLEILNTPVGRTYRVAAGTSYVTAVTDLITEIDPAAAPVVLNDGDADDVLPEDRIWEVDETHTYLALANALLHASGRRSLWVDENGAYRITVYQAPAVRPPEYEYDATDPATTLVHPERVDIAGWHDVPNEWIFLVDRPSNGVADGTDGSAGRYVVTNNDDGPASVNARDGLVRRVIERIDAADQAALIAQGDRIVGEQTRISRMRTLTTDPNPLHGHLDVCQLVDDELQGGKAIWHAWTLPLDGAPMSHDVEMI